MKYCKCRVQRVMHYEIVRDGLKCIRCKKLLDPQIEGYNMFHDLIIISNTLENVIRTYPK